jgi:hypothetical protein
MAQALSWKADGSVGVVVVGVVRSRNRRPGRVLESSLDLDLVVVLDRDHDDFRVVLRFHVRQHVLGEVRVVVEREQPTIVSVLHTLAAEHEHDPIRGCIVIPAITGTRDLRSAVRAGVLRTWITCQSGLQTLNGICYLLGLRLEGCGSVGAQGRF